MTLVVEQVVSLLCWVIPLRRCILVLLFLVILDCENLKTMDIPLRSHHWGQCLFSTFYAHVAYTRDITRLRQMKAETASTHRLAEEIERAETETGIQSEPVSWTTRSRRYEKKKRGSQYSILCDGPTYISTMLSWYICVVNANSIED